ncbi:MAG: hypothetical protein DMD30_00475 [Gemmatimonadetes bacterium]|nr:MAG: hypothetical protein DMD30_00475 [Gemmatimonadota bacterium]
MKIAVLDPTSGIAGDMFIGALIDVGLDKAWLERLPSTLGLTGVEVRIADVQRSGVQCVKVSASRMCSDQECNASKSISTFRRSHMAEQSPRSID